IRSVPGRATRWCDGAHRPGCRGQRRGRLARDGPNGTWAAPRVGWRDGTRAAPPRAWPERLITRTRGRGSGPVQAGEQAAGALAGARVGGHPPAVLGRAPTLRADEESADSLQKGHWRGLPAVLAPTRDG